MVNKARLVETHCGAGTSDKRIDGIADLRDESNRHGVRIVIELQRDANAKLIVNQLYKHTPLQDSFGVDTCWRLVNNEPKVLNLLQMLHLLSGSSERRRYRAAPSTIWRRRRRGPTFWRAC